MVDEGQQFDLPPPGLESHPPGGRLAYCRQEQPIAARAAHRRMTENAIVIVVAIMQGQAEARVWSQEIIEPQGLRPSSLLSSRWKSIDRSKTRFAHRKPSLQISIDRKDQVRLAMAKMMVYNRPYALLTSSKDNAINSAGGYIGRASKMCRLAVTAAADVIVGVIVVVVGIVVIVVIVETPPADGQRPINGLPLAPVGCIRMCSTTTMAASSLLSSLSWLSRWQSPAKRCLAAIAEDGEQRRYRRTLGEVRGRARMQKFSIPPRAIAENNGIKVGGGGGGLLWEGVETEPHVISSLYAPDMFIRYSEKRSEQLPPVRGQLPLCIWEKGKNRLIWKV
jgi:hypothetical protein